MFSVSPAEIITIAVIALLVFGPRKLPEIARKAGSILRDLRSATAELKAGIEKEYRDAVEPLDEARRDIRSALEGGPPALDAPSDGEEPPTDPGPEAEG